MSWTRHNFKIGDPVILISDFPTLDLPKGLHGIIVETVDEDVVRVHFTDMKQDEFYRSKRAMHYVHLKHCYEMSWDGWRLLDE